MNHLYVQTAFLGDLLLSIPTLKQIRYWAPQSKLTLICRKGYGRLIESFAICDEVIEVEKGNKVQLATQLQDRQFETVFCAHQSMSTHQLIKKIMASQKVGYHRWWNSSYFNQSVQRRLDWPEAIRQLQLLAAVDPATHLKLEAFENEPSQIPQWTEMTLSNLNWSLKDVGHLVETKLQGFKADRPYLCIAPGSVWPTKRWIKSHFIKVATLLARHNFQILVIGAAEERDLCAQVHAQVPNSFSAAGLLSVDESLMLLSKSKGLICNDSGAMHMASLLRLPTLAIFGPTVQSLGYKPWNPAAVVIETQNLLCRPCGQHGARFCPIITHRCMNDVKPEIVFDRAIALFS